MTAGAEAVRATSPEHVIPADEATQVEISILIHVTSTDAKPRQLVAAYNQALDEFGRAGELIFILDGVAGSVLRMPLTDIGDRIKFGRDAVGHGHWGDISAEALFYGLMTSLVFYNQA